MRVPSSTPTDISHAVHAEGLSKSFGDVPALEHVHLTVFAGELTALVGANGSGKSTLLKMLSGIVLPDEGTLRVMGMDPRYEAPALRAALGYAPQEITLDPEMTGRETLRMFHALRSLPPRGRDERLARLQAEYGLEEFVGRMVGTYSGGQRQRLHLALETMHEPRLLLLDEPTANLDPSARRALWHRLASFRENGCTVVVATHDLEDVAAHCDRVVLLKSGRVLASDRPGALVAAHCRASTIITLAQPAGENAEALRRVLGALEGKPEVTIDEFTVTLWRNVHPEAGEPALEALAAMGISYRRVERREPDLAGAYFRLSGSPLAGQLRGEGNGGSRGPGGRGPGGRVPGSGRGNGRKEQ